MDDTFLERSIFFVLLAVKVKKGRGILIFFQAIIFKNNFEPPKVRTKGGWVSTGRESPVMTSDAEGSPELHLPWELGEAVHVHVSVNVCGNV